MHLHMHKSVQSVQKTLFLCFLPGKYGPIAELLPCGCSPAASLLQRFRRIACALAVVAALCAGRAAQVWLARAVARVLALQRQHGTGNKLQRMDKADGKAYTP